MPLPSVFGVAPNGAVTGVFQQRVDQEQLTNAILTPQYSDMVKALQNQNGAPVRLVVPWKYGFKSIKSIVKIRFTETQPNTTWNETAPNEYGFYSNVNPNVDHPRWSQKKERVICRPFWEPNRDT